MTRKIFVFGSNLAGMHGGGSAAHAHDEHGAEWGAGVGPTGDSYAIPTLDKELRPLPLQEIAKHVADFLDYARANKDWTFGVVAIGCGIAGFKPEEIGPMFQGVPSNCIMPKEFEPYLEAA
jgi:hypothetical protein